MQEAIRFIQENFKQVAVLKDGASGLTELVIDPGKTVYIRKAIPYTGLPYQKLARLDHPLLPKIYYAAEDALRTYVIEQYVEGQNLQALLEAKKNLHSSRSYQKVELPAYMNKPLPESKPASEQLVQKVKAMQQEMKKHDA